MTQENYQLAIDAWLKSLRELETRKIRQLVVCALQAEHQMGGQDIFKIPFHLFESARITNREKQKSILANLHHKKIIDVSRKTNSFTETIVDNPEIIYSPDTRITVFPEKFNYLAHKLDEIVKGYEAKPTPTHQQRKQKIEWRSDFHWENTKFVFSDYGSIEFISPDRRKLFKSLFKIFLAVKREMPRRSSVNWCLIFFHNSSKAFDTSQARQTISLQPIVEESP